MTNLIFSQKNKGFAILLAILLVSIVLTIGLTLFNITYRQLLLSSLARESQYAFYASDSAMQCARYYDALANPTSRPFGHVSSDGTNAEFNLGGDGSTITCGPESSTVSESPGAGSSPVVYSFVVVFPQADRTTCAQVTITKYRDLSVPPPDENDPAAEQVFGKTRILARGYNNYNGTPVAPCHLDNDRTVERASELLY